MATNERMLLMAEHQLRGFCHAEEGYHLKDLLSSMGLTEEEWELLKANNMTDYMGEKIKSEIDEYFNQSSESNNK